ncbi:DUF1697 domain-containing protein [Pontibacter sp. G13]|uniref:DUF1697 domain-containing protein n=1 Tax=Pontibacter sp. G13 TaxID=3074898 RepID=UPI002888FAB4|nr:DUF1697 domain-containing protein [Pontibacter sp. G13]WNJ19521.1 DUF1697 domain-containing protein [Pontibacter sp. G13]
MNTYICLLRGINVSGQKKLPMAELRKLLSELGLVDVKTYIQSGNAVFRTTIDDMSELGRKIEARILEVFKFQVPIWIIPLQTWENALNSLPSDYDTPDQKGSLYVVWLDQSPDPSLLEAISAPEDDPTSFAAKEHWLYLYVPNGYGKTPFNNNFFERKLKQRATTRNWKTMLKLHEMAQLVAQS